MRTKTIRTWYGRKKVVEIPNAFDDLEATGPEPRPAVLFAPVYNGLAAGLSICEHFKVLSVRENH